MKEAEGGNSPYPANQDRVKRLIDRSAMSLQAFLFPLPETRFFKAGSYIYKFKIRGGSSYSGEEVIERHSFDQELEEIIRTVLGNLDSLQPFSSTNFNVFPYKKRWEGMSMVMCKHSEGKQRAYPFILLLYLEKNMQDGKQAENQLSPEKEEVQHVPSVSQPQSKRCRRDSPLEDAIIKDLMKDMEAGSKGSTFGAHMDNPHAEGKVKEDPGHTDKKGTKGFAEPQEESGVNTFRGSSGEVPPGTTEDMEEEEEEEEEEGDEEGENVDSVPRSPGRPGILTRLASHIFPFSLFFRDL
ncbi:membrane-anchored junction protein isoform X2 [Thunnus maccoyii]|uniref:membrane-anchored junction protein isoform X2 n=1 Tax=Thunnus maccoyii TaxID=8240 RepID=UPI001C4C67CC|nr:membrane-anchored junction protein isoform X2 [Thunnus maccoyii]